MSKDRSDRQQMQQHIAYRLQRAQEIRAEQEGQKERPQERTEPVVVSLSGIKQGKAQDDPEQRQDRER